MNPRVCPWGTRLGQVLRSRSQRQRRTGAKSWAPVARLLYLIGISLLLCFLLKALNPIRASDSVWKFTLAMVKAGLKDSATGIFSINININININIKVIFKKSSLHWQATACSLQSRSWPRSTCWCSALGGRPSRRCCRPLVNTNLNTNTNIN